MNLTSIQTKIKPLMKKYGVQRAALFGSAARRENHAKSDIDILVDMPQSSGLFDFLALKAELEEALNKKVDLVEYAYIKPKLRPYILKDQKLIDVN